MSSITCARSACILVASMLLVAGAPRAARAQAPVRSVGRLELLGKDVHVLAPRAHAGLIRGQVIATDSLQLIVAGEDADTVQVPFETIERLRLRAGVGSHLVDGLLGGIAGGVAGGVLMVLYVHGDQNSDIGDDVAFAVGAAPGFLIGGVAGLVLGHQRFVDARIR